MHVGAESQFWSPPPAVRGRSSQTFRGGDEFCSPFELEHAIIITPTTYVVYVMEYLQSHLICRFWSVYKVQILFMDLNITSWLNPHCQGTANAMPMGCQWDAIGQSGIRLIQTPSPGAGAHLGSRVISFTLWHTYRLSLLHSDCLISLIGKKEIISPTNHFHMVQCAKTGRIWAIGYWRSGWGSSALVGNPRHLPCMISGQSACSIWPCATPFSAPSLEI